MEEQVRNLKKHKGKLLYYREYKTGETIPVRQKKGKVENHLHFKPLVEKKYFEESTVKQWALDNFGGPSPQVLEGHFTMLHNYFLDYWGIFLGAEAIAIYVYLRRRCNMHENRDYCWPSVEDIALRVRKSRNTVNKYLEILEDYGFIYRFYVENPDKNNSKESSIIKVRMMVPFLPKELVEQLDSETKEKHEAEVSRCFKNPLLFGKEPEEKNNYKEIYNILEGKAVSSVLKQERKRQIEAAIFETEQSNIADNDKEAWSSVLALAVKKVSKPSFDTWLKNTYATFQESSDHTLVTIYVPTQFSLDWLKDRYVRQINDWLVASLGEKEYRLSFKCPILDERVQDKNDFNEFN